MDKRAELLALAEKRKVTRWEGYGAIGDYHDGAYECDFVSPYTKTAGNIDSKVFILLQDWCSHTMLSGPLDPDAAECGHTPSLPTNRNLVRRLKAHLGMSLGEVYATNLFPFVKMGSMNQAIPQRDLIRAAQEFALPQIRIVNPRLVICLGVRTFNAIRRAVNLEPIRNLAQAVESFFHFEESLVWCQAHTGALGQNNRNRGAVDRVSRDWERMRQAVAIVT